MGVEDVRKYMEAAMGKLSPAKAQDLAKSMVQGQGRDQVTKTAKDLLDWSTKNRERLADLVRSEVRSQMKSLGVASRDEVDALRKRVRELERAGKPAPKKRTAAKRSTSKRSTAAPAATSRPAPQSGPAGTEA